MKKLLLVSVLLVSTAWAALGEFNLVGVSSVPVSPAASATLEEMNAAYLLLGPQRQEFWDKLTPTQTVQMREDAQQKIRALAVAYARAHPEDPIRWVGIHHMLFSPPEFITGYKPGIDQAKGTTRQFWIVDEAAKAAWTSELARYEAELEAAPDVPWEIRERRAFKAAMGSMKQLPSLDRDPAAALAFEQKMLAVGERFPDGNLALDMLTHLQRGVIEAGGAGAEALWSRYAGSPNRALAQRASAELRKREAGRKGLTLGFTAVDGRKVDLKDLRGKVVLIDFWATWCGPCLAELPNVKRVYAGYHDRGFEIVGISLENANLRPTDSPEQAAAKVEKAKKVLTDFTARESMPWPQYFDGRHWKNFYVQELAVTGIPAMFLLDQEGKIVSTNARGEKLEAEVKRLLGL